MTSSARRFTHIGQPSHVTFGPGSIQRLPDEVDRLGLARVVVLSTPGQRQQAQTVADILGSRAVGVHAEAVMHVPTTVAEIAVAHVRDVSADGCLAVGGGSAVGLGKAIALKTGLPLLAVPTTYAGSEMTPVWGLTDSDGKRTGKDIRVLPVSVVYDVDLTLDLPLEISVTSAVNALAHSVESTYAPDTSPIVELMAIESARNLFSGIARVVQDPTDVHTRSDLLYGAWLAGSCLGATTMSLHHKLCHIIGGLFDLSHAWTHTVILPYVMAFNLPEGTRAHEHIAGAFGDDHPGEALYTLLDELGFSRSLADLGMPTDQLDLVVQKATQSPYANPRPVGPEDVRSIVASALLGGFPDPPSPSTKASKPSPPQQPNALHAD